MPLLTTCWPELVMWLLPHTTLPEVLVLSCILEKESQKYLGISTNDYYTSFFMGIVHLGIPDKRFTAAFGSDSSAVTCVSSSHFLRPEAFLLLPFQYSWGRKVSDTAEQLNWIDRQNICSPEKFIYWSPNTERNGFRRCVFGRWLGLDDVPRVGSP